MPIEEEVKHLKRMIEELRSAQESSPQGAEAYLSQSGISSPAVQTALEDLILNGMDKRFAAAIARKVGFELGPEGSKNPEAVMDQLAAEIMETVEIRSALASIQPQGSSTTDTEERPGPSVIALVGPTGVGKTTTVAKMASEALLRRGLKVGLVNLDSYKVAAFDQLGTYAKILNVPFRSTGSIEELTAAIQDFQSLDLVIVDTTGRSQRDPGSLKEMQTMLSTVPHIRTQLVLSVTTRDNELYDQAHRFSGFKPEGLIISKLDEGSIFGSIYNICQKAKLPLLYFTTGQRVPEDIEEATRERVAALILDL
jgi:flagellar biosynthesis protein FlhF